MISKISFFQLISSSACASIFRLSPALAPYSTFMLLCFRAVLKSFLRRWTLVFHWIVPNFSMVWFSLLVSRRSYLTYRIGVWFCSVLYCYCIMTRNSLQLRQWRAGVTPRRQIELVDTISTKITWDATGPNPNQEDKKKNTMFVRLRETPLHVQERVFRGRLRPTTF